MYRKEEKVRKTNVLKDRCTHAQLDKHTSNKCTTGTNFTDIVSLISLGYTQTMFSSNSNIMSSTVAQTNKFQAIQPLCSSAGNFIKVIIPTISFLVDMAMPVVTVETVSAI